MMQEAVYFDLNHKLTLAIETTWMDGANLSQEGLVYFCRFFFNVGLDQIDS